MSGRTTRRRVLRVTVPAAGPGGAGSPGGSAGPARVTASTRADLLAAEEPLGIRVDGTALSMTMRTPGDDVELAAGFLVGEAIVRGRDDIAGMKVCDGTTCGHLDHRDDEIGNIVDVALTPGVTVTSGARRSFMTTSACGVCGKTSIDDLCVLPQAPLSADTTVFEPTM
ncbi:MAG: formate dehydrogenase accessory sulfurtransferase FdhD, partial [Trebonia sp.]